MKVFYNFNFSAIEDCETQTGTMGLDILEIAQRVRYIKEMVPRLKDLDVEHIGAVSKNQIIEEYKKAEVFPFTCDPTQWTEGFSISTAEAINYGLVTLVSDKDALPSVYKDCAQIIEGKLKDSLQKWEDAIVKALTDETYKKQMILKGRDFARNHDWSIMVDKLEKLILSHPKLKTDTESKDMIKLNICSGPNVFPYPGWINLDREDISPYLNYLRSVSNIEAMPQSQKDLVKYLQAGGTIDFRIHDARKKTNFDDNSIEIIYLGQAIEHFAPLREIPFLLSECYRILKPGGVLRITTPDLDLLINCYLENDMNKFANEQPGLYKDSDAASQLAMLMYGSLGPNTTYDCYDGHQFLFTQKSLTSFLEKAKFKDIEFYNTAGKSKNKIMEQECNDAGVSHSLIVECVK